MSTKRSFEHCSNDKDSAISQKARKISSEKVELAKGFQDLADNAEDVRLNAALALVSRCKNNNGEDKEPSFELARPICARLIRGLCSSRKSARHGFFVALVEVLRLFKASSELKQGCLAMIEEHTKLLEGATRQERSHHLMGKMSAYTAVVHAKLFFNGSHVQMVRFKDLLNAMVDSSTLSPWLCEQFGTILCQTINILNRDRAPPEWHEAILEVLVNRDLIKSPVGVALWLEVTSKAPSAKLPKHVWRHRDPLCSQELPAVVSVFKRSTGAANADDQSDDGRQNTGARQGAPSFAWSVIIEHLSSQHRLAKPSKLDDDRDLKRFTYFWNEAVDNQLFTQPASHQKRSLGFQILLDQLQSCATPSLRCMLSKNMLHCLANQSAQPDRYLHTLARTVLDALATRARAQPEACPVILQALLSNLVVSNFDKRSKSNTVAVVAEAGLLDPKTSKRILEVLAGAFDAPIPASEHGVPNQKQSVSDLLSTLIQNLQSQWVTDALPKRQCVLECLTFLINRSYQGQEGGQEEDVDIMRGLEIARRALTTSLATIATQNNSQSFEILTKVSGNINSLLLKRSSLNEGYRHALNFLQKEQHKWQKETITRNPRDVFTVVFPLVIFSFADDSDDALDTFNELKTIYLKTILSQDDIDVIIDMLLSFVSRPSALYRRLAMRAFEVVSSHMGTNGLGALLGILDKKENLSGKNDIEQEIPDDPSDEGSAVSDQEKADVIENIEMDSNDSDVQEIDEASAGSESSDDADAESDTSELTRFNTALASTLGTTKNEDGGSDSSDESMDDDQMLALEPKLAEMFRQRLGEGASDPMHTRSKSGGGEKKQAQAAARRDILDFKNRVLDMLEIYLTRNSSNQLSLDTATPLLKLMRMTGSKQLREKAARILKAWQAAAKKKGEPPFITKAKDEPKGDGKQRTGWDVIHEVHQEGLASPFSYFHAGLCTSMSIFVCRCAIRGAKQEQNGDKTVRKRLKKIQKLYAETRETAEKEKKDQLLKTGFWREFEGWSKDVLRNTDGYTK